MPKFTTSEQTPYKEQLQESVWALIGHGKYQEALDCCKKLLGLFPNHSDVWYTASLVLLKAGNPQEALKSIEHAIRIQPSNPDWQVQKAVCLEAVGEKEQSQQLAKDLSCQKLSSAGFYSILGSSLTNQAQFKLALMVFNKAIQLQPNLANHYYNRATVERYLGEIQQAETSLERAIKLNPEDTEAYELRSQLRTQQINNNHVSELEKLLKNGFPNWRDQVRICYTLAKEYEDLEQYELAFARLKQGADLRRKNMRYQVSHDLDTMAQIQTVFKADLYNGNIPGYESAAPIFIIGLPRTGTTLVERILDTHSMVESKGELNNFALALTRLAQQTSGKRLNGSELVKLTATLDFKALGKAYIDSIKINNNSNKYVIDKMPMNFLYAGLIHLALPKAKIIHLTRHPMDTCYAIYKQLFKEAYPYSYDLDELGRYYLAYRQLMAHWQHVIPGVIYTVTYEQLVTDTHNEIKKLLAKCELSWEDNCLNFHKNTNASTTASALQIRKPIYHGSIRKWRQYRQQLQTLADVFTAAELAI